LPPEVEKASSLMSVEANGFKQPTFSEKGAQRWNVKISASSHRFYRMGVRSYIQNAPLAASKGERETVYLKKNDSDVSTRFVFTVIFQQQLEQQ
jgi:hypothetical protein